MPPQLYHTAESMTNWLTALRIAPNLETHARALQVELFRRDCNAGARLLPPLIPIAWVTNRPGDAELDRLRKQFRVSLTLPLQSGANPAAPAMVCFDGPRRGIGVPLADQSGQLEALVDRVVTGFGGQRAAERPVVALAWDDQPSPAGGRDPIPPATTVTQAFWLSLIEIHAGDDAEGPWWNGARWFERYRRRLTVIQAPLDRIDVRR